MPTHATTTKTSLGDRKIEGRDDDDVDVDDDEKEAG